MNISTGAGKILFEARKDSGDAFVLTYTGHRPADTFCIRSPCTDRISRLVGTVAQTKHAHEDLKLVIGDWGAMVSAGDVRELVRAGLGRQQPDFGFGGSAVIVRATGLAISQPPLPGGMADRSLTITHDASIPGGYTVEVEERRVFCDDDCDPRDVLDGKLYVWVGQTDVDCRASLLQAVRAALRDWGEASQLHVLLRLSVRDSPVVSLSIRAVAAAADAVDSLLDIAA